MTPRRHVLAAIGACALIAPLAPMPQGMVLRADSVIE
jgi:hypothetical protein